MKISRKQLRRIIREAIDPREMEEPLGGWVGDALTNDPDYHHPDDTDASPQKLKLADLVRSVDYQGDGWGGDYERVVGDQIGTVIEVDEDIDGTQYTVLFPDGTTIMDSAGPPDEPNFELVNENKMRITKRQLRRLIREEKARLMREDIGTGRYRAIEVVETAITTMRSLAEAPGAADPVAQEMLAADAQDLETIVLGFLEKIS